MTPPTLIALKVMKIISVEAPRCVRMVGSQNAMIDVMT